MAPKKLWRQILTRKTKEDNKIALKDWYSYLKNIYESQDIRDNIQTLVTMKEVFLLEDIDFRVKHLANGKSKEGREHQTLHRKYLS